MVYQKNNILSYSGIYRVLFVIIVFLSGYDLALPVSNQITLLPFWARPIQLIHGIYAYQALLILLIIFVLIVGYNKRIKIYLYALMIGLLGVLGIVSASVNSESVFDLFEALRFIFFASYFIVLVYGAKKYGVNSILRTFLIGVGAGLIINLFYTHSYQYIIIDGLPMLLGQNGPGGAVGICIGLSALLMLIRQDKKDKYIAIAFTIIAIYAVIISFSKVGQWLGLLGLFSWIAVYFSIKNNVKVLLIQRIVIVFLLISSFGFFQSPKGEEVFRSVKFFTSKLFNEKIADSETDQRRFLYYDIVFNIVASNPIFGVSYSGFYDAVNSINVPIIEFETSKENANPHNSFLYYSAANGLLGLFVCFFLYIYFIYYLYLYLRRYEIIGLFLWLFLSFAYFLYGNALPTLFNTSIMYLPTAMVFSQLIYVKLSDNSLDS